VDKFFRFSARCNDDTCYGLVDTFDENPCDEVVHGLISLSLVFRDHVIPTTHGLFQDFLSCSPTLHSHKSYYKEPNASMKCMMILLVWIVYKMRVICFRGMVFFISP